MNLTRAHGLAVPARLFALLAIAGTAIGLVAGASGGRSIDPDGIWRDVAESSLPATGGVRDIVPQRYRTVEADLSALDRTLFLAPHETTVPNAGAGALLTLPLPDGTTGRFRIVESPIMEPALAARFPEITTWAGQGVDDPTATVRLDRTPAGFHAMILSAAGTVFIDPYRRGDTTHHIIYWKRDFVKRLPSPLAPDTIVGPLDSGAPDRALVAPPQLSGAGEAAYLSLAAAPGDSVSSPATSSGTQLRTYRLALAATGEYTQFFGGTVPQALAAMMTTINRVDGVYEREFAIRMVLIANTNLLVYTNGATDPYTNSNGFAMLSQNQSNIDSVIGNANYDFGHVFSTGGGGVSNLGVICRSGLKAQSVTGLPTPVGDPFDIDYVAHEMGHEFGGNHTFNSTTSSCGGGNRNASTAYEPGSASTIMGYAGICGSANLQPHSDDYFHTVNFDEIVNYTTVGAGNGCAAITGTGNNPPAVNAGPSYTIPVQTPFTLTGSGVDPDGDALTYGWEEFDLGTASPPDTDNGNRPIFRSFLPTASPSRTFPKLTDILNNNNVPPVIGESLPTTTRALKWRLTARDNRSGGGGVNYASLTINTTATAGPFAVTAPNTAVTWGLGTQQTVSWSVANTTAAPVSCPSVNILLSTDGGATFGQTLAAGTPNDGSQTVTAPSTPTSAARVKVECANNIFFDIGNTDFTIGTAQQPVVRSSAIDIQFRTNTPRQVRARIHVTDGNGAIVSGAVVSGFFTLPDGSTQNVSGTSNATNGFVVVQTSGTAGVYMLTITDISAAGYVFDASGSVLTQSVTVP